MRRTVTALAAALLVLSAGGHASADHDFEDWGTVQGTVTRADGAPAAEACVLFYEMYFDDGEGEVYWYDYPAWITQTEPDGTYSVDMYATGYVVEFRDCSDSPTLLPQWFAGADERADATPIQIGPSTTTTGVDAVLRVGGLITGTVTSEDGAALEGICVKADSIGDDDEYDDEYAWYDFPTHARTDSAGRFRIGALATGDYRVRYGCDSNEFDPAPQYVARTEPLASAAVGGPVVSPEDPEAWVGEWFDDAETEALAAVVDVHEGHESSGIDAELQLGGAVSGTVTAEGRPLEYPCVSAYAMNGAHVAGTMGDDHGLFVLLGLRPGTYKIEFNACYNWLGSEWYSEAGSFQTATPVEVFSGELSGNIDATLERPLRPDLAITDLTVENVPIRTDVATVPAGVNRTVHARVGNVGEASWSSFAVLFVRVETPNGEGDFLGYRFLYDMEPGEERAYTFDWDGRGYIGDAEVIAELCMGYYSGDDDYGNNRRTADSYVGVGGTGFGRALFGESSFPFCSSGGDF